MRMHTLAAVGLMLCLALVFTVPCATAQTPGVPPHIGKILKKLESGKEITAQEEAALEKWGGAAGDADQEPSPGWGEQGDGFKAMGGSGCSALAAVGTLPAKAPTRAAYLALGKEVSLAYGTRIGRAKPKIDSLLRMARKDSDGADLGALFVTMGAGSAAAYATAWSAMRTPDDALTASNLAVALKAVGDHGRALQALLYAGSLKPDAPLVAMNLGWTYFELGDYAKAKGHFSRADRLSPRLGSAQLGLGLVATCQGNRALGEQLLRAALRSRHSVLAAGVLRAAQGTREPGSGTPPAPVATEKAGPAGFTLPTPPISPQRGRMRAAAAPLQQLEAALDRRIQQLQEERAGLARVLGQQMARAMQPGANAIVIPRDFDKELFLLEDLAVLLLGQPGEVGAAGRATGKQFDELTQRTEKLLPGMEDEGRRMERALRDQEVLMQQHNAELEALRPDEEALRQVEEQIARCAPRTPGPQDSRREEACVRPLMRVRDARQQALERKRAQIERKYQALYDRQQLEAEQRGYRSCVQHKGMLEDLYTTQYKAWKTQWDAFERAARDYYAFSTPIIERVYPPTLNELLHVERQLQILGSYRAVEGLGAGLPALAEQIEVLECVEPEPPAEPEAAREPTLPKKRPKPCPFKKPLSVKVMSVGLTLDCQKAKIEAGEGLIGSVERDFTRKETTLFIGAGASVDLAVAEAGAKVGLSLTTNGDGVQDVALESSIGASVLGSGAELGGRLALEGGADMGTVEKVGLTLGGVEVSRDR